jgi:hypothetical protein
MRNERPTNCHIRMVWAFREINNRSGQRGTCFLAATIPGIWPVLVQKKQVDQANATQRQVVGDLAVEFEGAI